MKLIFSSIRSILILWCCTLHCQYARKYISKNDESSNNTDDLKVKIIGLAHAVESTYSKVWALSLIAFPVHHFAKTDHRNVCSTWMACQELHIDIVKTVHNNTSFSQANHIHKPIVILVDIQKVESDIIGQSSTIQLDETTTIEKLIGSDVLQHIWNQSNHYQLSCYLYCRVWWTGALVSWLWWWHFT